MTTLYAIGGLVVALAISVWLAMRSARHEGAAAAKIEALTDGKAKERAANEILARAIPGPDDVVARMLNDRPKP